MTFCDGRVTAHCVVLIGEPNHQNNVECGRCVVEELRHDGLHSWNECKNKKYTMSGDDKAAKWFEMGEGARSVSGTRLIICRNGLMAKCDSWWPMTRDQWWRYKIRIIDLASSGLVLLSPLGFFWFIFKLTAHGDKVIESTRKKQRWTNVLRKLNLIDETQVIMSEIKFVNHHFEWNIKLSDS